MRRSVWALTEGGVPGDDQALGGADELVPEDADDDEPLANASELECRGHVTHGCAFFDHRLGSLGGDRWLAGDRRDDVKF